MSRAVRINFSLFAQNRVIFVVQYLLICVILIIKMSFSGGVCPSRHKLVLQVFRTNINKQKVCVLSRTHVFVTNCLCVCLPSLVVNDVHNKVFTSSPMTYVEQAYTQLQ